MANLSANDLLQSITWTLYVVIFVITGFKALSRRRRVDVDITLLFGATTVIILLSLLTNALPVGTRPFAGLVAAGLVLSLPYLLVRLVDDFAGVPALFLRIAEAGLALSIVGFFALPQPFPTWFVSLAILYFVALEIFGAIAFIRAAGRSRGVTRRRMQAV